jgi:hypothetical protein
MILLFFLYWIAGLLISDVSKKQTEEDPSSFKDEFRMLWPMKMKAFHFLQI